MFGSKIKFLRPSKSVEMNSLGLNLSRWTLNSDPKVLNGIYHQWHLTRRFIAIQFQVV